MKQYFSIIPLKPHSRTSQSLVCPRTTLCKGLIHRVWFYGSTGIASQYYSSIIPVLSQYYPSTALKPHSIYKTFIECGFRAVLELYPSIIPVLSQYHPSTIPVPSQYYPSTIPVLSQYYSRTRCWNVTGMSQLNYPSIIPVVPFQYCTGIVLELY